MSPVSMHEKSDDPPGLNLYAGSYMDIKVLGFSEVFKAMVIGQARGEYLLIKPFLPEDEVYALYSGATVYSSYEYRDAQFGFESQVLEIIQRPYPLTFISYPDRVDHVQKRRVNRACCHIASSLMLNNNSVKGTVTNISRRGCRFVIRLPEHLMPKQITLFDDITLSLPCQGGEKTATFHGAVRNTMIDRKKISMGIEFSDLDSKHLSHINERMGVSQSV